MFNPVFSFKVIGTFSLGIWAGYNTSLVLGIGPRTSAHVPDGLLPRRCAHCLKEESASTSSVQALHAVFGGLMKSLHVSVVSVVVLASNALAYHLSKRADKHPYLLYVALAAPLVGALQGYGSAKLAQQARLAIDAASEPEPERAPSATSETSDEYEHVNADDSKPRPAPTSPVLPQTPAPQPDLSVAQKYEVFASVVAGLSAFLSLVSVVGLAGDRS